MNPINITIPTLDDQTMNISCFQQEGQPSKASIVICPATGVLHTFYNNIASYLAADGFTVYTFNYRGIGIEPAEAIKDIDADLSTWSMEIQSVAHYVKKENSNQPIFALTHSIGGQLLGISPYEVYWDGIITVASQSGYWPLFKGKYKARMLFFWYMLLPLATRIAGYFPAKRLGLFENLPKGAALQWGKWGKSPNYMKVEFSEESFEKITCPVRGISISDDHEFAPKEAVDWLHNQFTAAEVERVIINPSEHGLKKLGHFNFFRSTMKDLFWGDILQFFNQQVKRTLKPQA